MSTRVGVIEGFFGRAWPDATRLALMAAFADLGSDLFIYAPKSDRSLRKDWQRPFTPEEAARLAALAGACGRAGLSFGVGFSPFEFWRADGPAARSAVMDKVARIEGLGARVLALLFDDMRGDHPDLAAVQADLSSDIHARFGFETLIVCPTYYSFDPILDKVFGPRPADYLATLGQRLPSDVDIFWTGPRVGTPRLERADADEAAAALGRPAFIWDNSLANDGRERTTRLFLKPDAPLASGADRAVRGIAHNPMNPPWATVYALTHLTGAGCDGGCALPASVPPVPEGLEALIARDAAWFATDGVSALPAAEIDRLKADYGAFITCPYARDILDWLAGAYAFDPACLTD